MSEEELGDMVDAAVITEARIARWRHLWTVLGATDEERDIAAEVAIEHMADAGFGPEDEEVQAAFEIGFKSSASERSSNDEDNRDRLCAPRLGRLRRLLSEIRLGATVALPAQRGAAALRPHRS